MRWIEDLNDPVCSFCGSKENVTFGSDHYLDEIFGKKNPVWECEKCRKESMNDI